MKKIITLSLLLVLLATSLLCLSSCGFQYHNVGYVTGELSESFLNGNHTLGFQGYSFDKMVSFKGAGSMAAALRGGEIQYLLANKSTADAILTDYSDIKALSATLDVNGESVYVLTTAKNVALDHVDDLGKELSLFQKSVMGYIDGELGDALLLGGTEVGYEFYTSKIDADAAQVAKALRNHKIQYLVLDEILADKLLADIAQADQEAVQKNPDAKPQAAIKKAVDSLAIINDKNIVLLTLADNTVFDATSDAWATFKTMQKVPVIGYVEGEASAAFLKNTASETMSGYDTKTFDGLSLMTDALVNGSVEYLLVNDTTATALLALDSRVKAITTPLAQNNGERVLIVTLTTNTAFDGVEDVLAVFESFSKSDFQVQWDLFYSKFITHKGYKDALNGLVVTMEIAVLGLLIGIVIGTAIALIKMIPKYHVAPRILSAICDVYVGFFRGTPMVVQLLIGWFILLPALDLQLDNVVVAIAVFGMNSGAYVSEIMRSGIQAVDAGQLEAARAVGLGYWTSMMKIVIPQGVKNILPTLGNEFIVLVKDTSIVSFIAVVDVTKAFRQIGDANYSYIIPYMMLALVYLVIVMIITLLIKLLERRLAKSERRK